MPVLGLHLLSTTIAALDGGVTYRPDGSDGPFWAGVAGGEVGVAGVQARLGVGRYWPSSTDWFGPGAEISVRINGTFLRTWGNPFHVEPHQSFLGVELQGMYLLIGVRIGYFRRVAGNAPDNESFFTAGVLLGWQ